MYFWCMEERIAESELVLNADGSIYHLHVRPEQVADKILIAGDPGRIALISSFFDTIEHQVENREFVTHTGMYKGMRVSAIATGIGTDNMDIVLNELDALFSIDFATRTRKPKHTPLSIVRIGTSGALQADIPPDSFVASTWGLGLDNLLHFYRYSHTPEAERLLQAFSVHTSQSFPAITPYCAKASDKLLKVLSPGMHTGITATAPGFYGPQGRTLRLAPAIADVNQTLNSFRYHEQRITNFEMETSALYGLAQLLGHDACTVCTIVANRFTRTFSKDYQASIKELVQLVLERLTQLG